MAKQWQEEEQTFAQIFGVNRAWANSGGRYDFPRGEELEQSPVIGQVKNVKTCSLAKLTALAEEMAEEAPELCRYRGRGFKVNRRRVSRSFSSFRL